MNIPILAAPFVFSYPQYFSHIINPECYEVCAAVSFLVSIKQGTRFFLVALSWSYVSKKVVHERFKKAIRTFALFY